MYDCCLLYAASQHACEAGVEACASTTPCGHLQERDASQFRDGHDSHVNTLSLLCEVAASKIEKLERALAVRRNLLLYKRGYVSGTGSVGI